MDETEQPDYSGGCMLAIYPPADIAAALALSGGLNPADLHCTVAYTGNAADVDAQDLIAAALDAARQVGPFTATVSGSARFTGGEQDVLVALIDAPELEDLRRTATDALAAHGVPVARTHGFTPHITRRYAQPEEDDTGRLAPLTFLAGSLSVVHGATRIDIPLNAKTESAAARFAAQAREAYAEGWARSGGPMTDRVKAGCAAAVGLACEHPHQPGILEATLRLGSLEGTWATVFQRRDELLAKHAAAMLAAWRAAVSALDTGALVRDLRTALGIAEAGGNRDALARAKQAARDAAASLLAWLPAARAWQALRDTMREALRSGRAEGVAGAIALAGEETGKIGVDFDLAFTDAYNALANLGQLWADADGWLGRMVNRCADELGRALAPLAADGAPYADMLAAAGGVLDGADGDAVAFITDWAMNTALSRGALDLYAGEGAALADWITAGGGNVCPICQDNEANSPYPLAAFPEIPAHARCRCSPSASFDVSRYSAYFAG